MLADKLNMTPEEAERWIVNLIRNARLDAKIDSKLVSIMIALLHTREIILYFGGGLSLGNLFFSIKNLFMYSSSLKATATSCFMLLDEYCHLSTVQKNMCSRQVVLWCHTHDLCGKLSC